MAPKINTRQRNIGNDDILIIVLVSHIDHGTCAL